MPTKLICHTPDCVSCGADGTCKLAGEIRVDQKRCQSYTPHSIPFMEKPLALSELPKEEWVCHILEESGATFVSLEDFYEPYGKALRRDLIWRIPYGCLTSAGASSASYRRASSACPTTRWTARSTSCSKWRASGF